MITAAGAHSTTPSCQEHEDCSRSEQCRRIGTCIRLLMCQKASDALGMRVQNADLWHDFCVHQSRLCRFRGAEFASTFSDWYSANQALSTTLQQAMTAANPCIEGGSTDDHSVPVLSDDWNTLWLWHGTTPATALIVAEFGTDQRVASLNGLSLSGSPGRPLGAMNACRTYSFASHQAPSS